MAENTNSSEEFDRKFDAGEDISEYIDWSKAKRPGREQMTKIIHKYEENRRPSVSIKF